MVLSLWRLLGPAAASIVPVACSVPLGFEQWAAEHGKAYPTDEAEAKAMQAFQANGEAIAALRGDPEDSAEYGHTRFSDLSHQEFKKQLLPFKMDAEEGRRGAPVQQHVDVPLDLPSAMDWRDAGAVTPVKDQAACGSCWAESAVSCIESQWYLANKASMQAPVPLSVEEVVECDAHDYACYGGYPRGAYTYVIENGGLSSQADYPYVLDGKGVHTVCLANQTYNATCGDGMCDDPPLTAWCDITCSDKTHRSVARISSWRALPTNEDAMVAYLVQHGPISVAIDAAGGAIGVLLPWLQFYKRGIANPRRCTTDLDHAVLAVGYGEENGEKYWVIKNSWGTKWGESGYFRLVRDANKCGIATMATAAVVGQYDAMGAFVV